MSSRGELTPLKALEHGEGTKSASSSSGKRSKRDPARLVADRGRRPGQDVAQTLPEDVESGTRSRDES